MSDFVNITRNNNDIISTYSANPDSEGDVGDGGLAAQLAQITSNQIILQPSGADDSANIDNAITNCPTGGTIVFMAGTYTKTTHTTLKSNMNIKSIGQVTVNITCTGTEAILAQSLNHVVIEGNITFTRQGTASDQANHSVIAICGNTDNTFVIRGVRFTNQMAASDYNSQYISVRGVHIYDTAAPLLYGVIGVAGTASLNGGACGISVGAVNNAAATPRLYDCIGFGGGGSNGVGIEADNQVATARAEYHNCVAYGGSASGGAIQVDDQDSSIFYNPIAYGGTGSYCDALHVYSTGNPQFFNGLFYPGTGASCDGVQILDGTPEFFNCKSEVGRNNNSRAWYTAPGSLPRLKNCHATMPKGQQTYWYTNANKTFTPSANDPFRLITVRVWAYTPQAAGTTVNIGTTAGGSDIAANVPISDANFRDFPYTGSTVFAANSLLYVTPSTTIPDNSVRITTDVYHAYSSIQGFAIAGRGVTMEHCTSRTVNGAAMTVDTATVTANLSEFNHCIFERLDASTNNSTVYLPSQWSQPFKKCTVIGTFTNSTIPGDLVYLTFTLDNVAANLSNVQMNGSLSSNFKQVYLLKQGQVESIYAQITTLPTAGSATLKVNGSGNVSGVPTVTLDTSHGGVHIDVTTFDSTNLISANGALGVQISTTSNFAPTTASVIVTLAVRLSQV